MAGGAFCAARITIAQRSATTRRTAARLAHAPIDEVRAARIGLAEGKTRVLRPLKSTLKKLAEGGPTQDPIFGKTAARPPGSFPCAAARPPKDRHRARDPRRIAG